MLGFQYADLDSDHDPTSNSLLGEGATSGSTSDTIQPVSVVYTETISDFKQTNTGCWKATISLTEYLAGTAAHEVMHGFRLEHDGTLDGGLMCATLKTDVRLLNRAKITEPQKATIRRTIQPRDDAPARLELCPPRPGCSSLEAEP